METTNTTLQSDKKIAKIIAIVNAILIPLICITFFKPHDRVLESSIITFLLASFAGLVNFILMIAFILKGKRYTYIICLICMILIPLIGLGGCQFAFSTTSTH